MATISRTGIAGGSTISPTHITNIIDALDGTSATTTVVASGSFSGSLTGHATSATTATTASYVLQAVSASFATTATTATSATTATTASYVLQAVSASFAVSSSIAVSSSFATTASYVANASSFPFTGSAIISGSLRVTGSLDVSAGITASMVSTPQFIINSTTGSAGSNLLLDLGDIAKTGGTGKFIIPKQEPTSPVEGTMYWDTGDRVLYIYNEATTSWIAIGP
jgi:hypothetical protein